MTPLTTDHSQAQLESPHSVFIPHTNRAQRLTSFDVADFPMPTGREEEWRFSPLKSLRPALADLPEQWEPSGFEFDVDEVAGVSLTNLAPGEAPRGTVLVPGDRAAALASAGCPNALWMRIDPDWSSEAPIHIKVHGKAGARENAHFLIEFGDRSNATVIFEHTGSGYYAGNVEVIVGESATATVVSQQLWEDDAVHVGQHEAEVGPNASYKHVAVTLGGEAVRLTVNAHYRGEGGTANLLGVYFADAGQHQEHQTYIDHNAPTTVSRVTYKGALQGEGAHAVWIGDVLIRAEAEGIDTYELNRNLVLTDGARADSVPNLEIETGLIEGAGHASATGRFDDEQLFYLRSRGIPELDARRLVVRGFFADLVHEIGVAEVEESLMQRIEAELDAAMTALETQ